MNSYRPKHFALVELIDESTFKERGNQAWDLLRPDFLRTLDQLRERFGPITVNNWHIGGQYQESGLRRPESATGAKWTMHKFGGAGDLKFRDLTPAEVSAAILAKPEDFPFLTTLENVEMTVTWLHVDVRNHARDGIWIVNP